MLKTVIFDLDGLLVDSTPLQSEAMRLFIESFGKIYLSLHSGREGMRIIDIIRDFKDIYNLPGEIKQLYQKRQGIYFHLAKNKLQLFPGVREFLEKIRRRELKSALATSGDREYVQLVMNKFSFLRDCLQVVVTGDDVLRGKPYPDIYLKTLEKSGVKNHEAVVIEDSINGIMAAKAAKIQVICIPNRNYPDADYGKADRVFEDFAELARSII